MEITRTRLDACVFGWFGKEEDWSVVTLKRPEYQSWQHMKDRCLNPNNDRYHQYGGRGITIHQPWIDSFQIFLNDVGTRPSPRHTLGRIHNDGHYEPGNVEWQTAKQQANNRSTNIVLEFNGMRHNLQEWANLLGIHRQSMIERLRRNLPPSRLFARKPPNRPGVSRMLTLNGEAHNLTRWAEITGLSPRTIRTRLDEQHFSVEAALLTPKRH